jgi:hypothetical protein
MGTLNVDEIVNGLFQSKLFNQEGLLLFGQFFEEVFEITIPNLSHL